MQALCLPRREFALNKANKDMLLYAMVSFIVSVFNILRFKKNQNRIRNLAFTNAE